MTEPQALPGPFTVASSQQSVKTALQGPLGSVYLGSNNSYSGCDIKVLINMYDGGTATKDQSASLQGSLSNYQTQMDTLQKQLGSLQSKVDKALPGTQEWGNYLDRIDSTNRQIQSLQDSVVSTQNKLTSLKNAAQPTGHTKVLAECQTLSVSIYRDKRAVRACGSVGPRGVVRDQREIAGTLVFTVFDQSVFYEFLQAHASDFDSVSFGPALMDQLPPVDILVSFANEYGDVSRMTIYGVEFMTEGQTMSIEDLLTENPVNYIARGIDPMRQVGSRVKTDDASAMLQASLVTQTASALLNDDDYQNFQKDSQFDRYIKQNNPFV